MKQPEKNWLFISGAYYLAASRGYTIRFHNKNVVLKAGDSHESIQSIR